jgi:hypothetical protein
MTYTTFPTRTLNGSSMRTLAEDHTKAYHALEQALQRLAEVAPHGRDYIGREEVYQAARAEHDEQLRSIRKLIDFHLAKAMHCFDQSN